MNELTRAHLRAVIKGSAEESANLRHRKNYAVFALPVDKIVSTIGPLNAARRSLGWEARHYLLAYGLLRGKTYEDMERKCAAHNKPDPAFVHTIIVRVSDLLTQLAWPKEVVELALHVGTTPPPSGQTTETA